MDDDLTKYVVVSQSGREITVRIRYGTDVALEEEVRRFRASGPVTATADNLFVTLAYETVHLFGLIRLPRTRRF